MTAQYQRLAVAYIRQRLGFRAGLVGSLRWYLKVYALRFAYGGLGDY